MWAFASSVLVILVALSLKKAFFPLSELSKQAKAMTLGDITVRAKIKRTDEIGNLAEDFNNMVDSVQKNIELLEETAKQRELYAANLAHELKTPITSIIGYADLAGKMKVDEHSRYKMMEYIKREGQRIDKLSEKMLDWSTLGAKKHIEHKMCKSEKIIDHITMILSPLLENNSQKLVVQNEAQYIYADESLIISLIVNLIHNALKASDNGQSVKLKIKNSDDNTIIEVIDKGIGVDENNLGRIREP